MPWSSRCGVGGHAIDLPQKTGVLPLDPCRPGPGRPETAEVAKQFIAQAEKILAGQAKANGLTMCGFSKKPDLPMYKELYGLRAAAIAVYPMYKGLRGWWG